MKRQKSCGPRLGKLVHQLPGVVTFAYDLCFRHMIARWKGIIEEIHFGGTLASEVNISVYASTTFSTFFCYEVRLYAGVVDVIVIICSPSQ
jgi:hypothetical protein